MQDGFRDFAGWKMEDFSLCFRGLGSDSFMLEAAMMMGDDDDMMGKKPLPSSPPPQPADQIRRKLIDLESTLKKVHTANVLLASRIL